MFSRPISTAAILVTAGLLLVPTLGLLPDTIDRSVHSQPHETNTTTSAFAILRAATDTATVTVTSTNTPTASSTPTDSATATVTATSSETATPTATASSTTTPTPSETVTDTETPTPSATPTSTATGGPSPTATPTLTSTPTATSAPGTGSISGRVTVQGRPNAQGVQIKVDGTPAVVTASDGSFEATGVASGTHVVRASLAGYLSAEKSGVTVVAGQTTAVSTVKLPGGDADGDSFVGLLDLVIVAGNYNTNPPGDSRADINVDGWANIFDLVLVASNYQLAGPIPWP